VGRNRIDSDVKISIAMTLPSIYAGSAIALTLAALVLVVVVFARRLAEKIDHSHREVNLLRNEVTGIRAENLKGMDHATESLRAVESLASRLREEAQLRLAELEVDFRNHAIGVRELMRAHSEQVRAQGAQITTEIAGSVEVAGQILVRMDALSGQFLEIAALRANVSELSTKLSDCSKRIDVAGSAVVGLPSEMLNVEVLSPNISALSASLSDCLNRVDAAVDTVSGLSSQIGDLRSDYTTLADNVEVMLHMPSRSFPIDQQALREKAESEIVALAEAVAIVRPLVPYPRWRFDADWANPDLAFQLRQFIWQYFNDRRSENPIVIGWYYGTRLALYLGNDLSRQIYIAGCIEPNEFAFLDRFLQPGMTVFDAGANEGVYSVFAASRVGAKGAVWAFEPSPRELKRLQKNLALNQLGVRVFPMALADRGGEAELKIASYEHEGQNTLGAFVYDIESSGNERVQLSRLDDLVAQNPPGRIDLIKVDVEGAEIRLFAGASETLRQYRPFLLFEASDGALKNQGGNREELLTMLRDHGYTIYCFDPHSGLPAPPVSGRYSDNLIGAPQGKTLPDSAFHPWPALLQ
jgi:FkbM family methyltransferase